MRINEDCIREVLKHLVETLTLNIKDNKGDFNNVSMLSVMKKFDDTYSREDVWYSIYNLAQDRFIEANNIREQSRNGFAFVNIYNVTHRGHQFYESIRPEPIWNKTKSIISKVGVHTLDFIEGVAHDVAVESAKQATAIMMTQKPCK